MTREGSDLVAARLAVAALLLTACGWDELDALAPALASGETGSTDAAAEGNGGGESSDGRKDAQSQDDGGLDATTVEDTGAPDGASPADADMSSVPCNSGLTPVQEWAFDSDTEGWILSMNSGVLGGVSWNDNVGDPSLGALQVEITSALSDGGAANGAWAEYQATALGNLTGRTISAWLWLDSGPSPNIKLFVQTGSQYTWADNGTVQLASHGWTCISMAVSSPSYTNGPNYDPTSVVRIGFEMVGSSPFRVFVDTVRYY